VPRGRPAVRAPAHGRREPTGRRAGPRSLAGPPAEAPAHARFLDLEPERAEREWRRYEGTPQRDLFRVVRERFLGRHAVAGGWAVDLGAGPGRFTGRVGPDPTRRLALDLSAPSLRLGRERTRTDAGGAAVGWVRGDALRPPLRPAAFAEVVLIGNTLGFELDRGPQLLERTESLVAPGGVLLVEIAPGPGEHARYLARLPPGAVRRLLLAPARAIVPRIAREGYVAEPLRHGGEAFRRWTVAELHRRWSGAGWRVRETLAVAPGLGQVPATVAEVASDPRAWERLVALEELLGLDPPRWRNAAAVLLAVERPLPDQTI